MPAVPRTILLIDDDEFVAGSLRHYLVSQGWRVDNAHDAGAATALMTANHYSVILVDPYLTGSFHQDGRALIASIQRMQPDAPVIVLTGYRSPEVNDPAAALAVAAILAKPQSVVALENILVRASAGRETGQVP